ncbi:MAG: helix-turn-helix transcriptional regulator [Reyranella sp.]|uniref:helix-turn-helix transcriptional regulator n=1 Tax=Reyranella sp. TaxID=1929291 RepID=UPI001AC98046|nr:helix-turn-helix transcriptional regulator [Reyranella sp.]MBN9087896.1 helix-turn-helix transcriptional regulator [Reyranella sp.]
MGGDRIDRARLKRANARLSDAAVDPAIWPEIMEEISAAAGATGAVLLQSDVRTSDVPRTSGLDDFLRKNYFAEGWHQRDVRADRGVPLLLRGQTAIIDQDLVTPEEMKSLGLYAELMIPKGLGWFSAIGFWSGPSLWGLSIQRAWRDGPYEQEDKRIFGRLSRRLSEAATLSQAVGRVALAGMTNALELVHQPALALDRRGFVLDFNPGAARLFDNEMRLCNHRLVVRDKQASAALAGLVDRMRLTPDTSTLPCASIVVQRSGRRPVIVRVLPVDGAARTPFLGARTLLVLTDLEAEPVPESALMARAFGLSPAESRIATLVAGGLSPRQAADELGIVYETARAHLKAVFDKTGAHRQSELVALLLRLSQKTRPRRGGS